MGFHTLTPEKATKVASKTTNLFKTNRWCTGYSRWIRKSNAVCPRLNAVTNFANFAGFFVTVSNLTNFSIFR